MEIALDIFTGPRKSGRARGLEFAVFGSLLIRNVLRHMRIMAHRAAMYLRVSGERQTTDNQRPEVERLATARGYTVVVEYEEQATAVKFRPKYEAMLRDAKRGKFDVLVVWAIDRLGRSLLGNLQDILELDRIGVQIVSVRETWLDTSGPVRSLLIAVFSWAAEQERARLVERTKLGLARARRQGVQLGRPRAMVDVDRARELRAAGKTLRQVAAELGIGTATLHRALASGSMMAPSSAEVG